jgi:Phosphotransferase enzyme family
MAIGISTEKGHAGRPAASSGGHAPTPQPMELRGTTEQLLALLARSRPRPSTIDTTVSRVIRLSQLRAEQGPASAVLKIARAVVGAEELRTQRRALAEIVSQPGLAEEWLELLPRILAFDERTDATVSVESYWPGIDLAEVLARQPHRVEELTAVALSAIAPLHQATARLIVVDNVCVLRQCVVEPVADLTHVCQRLDPRLVPQLEQLETMLAQALVGRRMPVCWTHGDYSPGNVRVAGMQGPVNGIVGWGGAQGDRPALIDEYLMILTASCQAQRADLGALVSERLRAGGLSDSERTALRAACERSGTDFGARERIDERLAILLTWLHHAAALWRKRATPPNYQVWWAANVTPVLEAVAGWRELNLLSRRPSPRSESMTTSSRSEDAAQAQGDEPDG